MSLRDFGVKASVCNCCSSMRCVFISGKLVSWKSLLVRKFKALLLLDRRPSSDLRSLGQGDHVGSTHLMDSQIIQSSPLGKEEYLASTSHVDSSNIQSSPLGQGDTASTRLMDSKIIQSSPLGKEKYIASTSHLGSNSIQSSPLGQGDAAATFPADSNDIKSSRLGHRDKASKSPLHFNKIQSGPLSHRTYKYDVFLSFAGTDTRNNFTDHLYNHLIRKGIFTFKDDKELEKGQPISPQLLEAIKDSRVSIVVFSRDYASSTWCLEEMAAIAECKEELEQTVFSIFYNVDPSHVRYQGGVYKNAFELHTKKFEEAPDTVDRWKRAMMSLANLAGWDVRNKTEFQQIENIVEVVIKVLGHKFSRFADDLVGIQPRVDELENLLNLSLEDDDFRVLGIWGMGGIGKTTYATVLYDRISYQFDGACFIEDVSKIYRDGGAITVQKQILYQTLGEKNLETSSPSEISRIFRNRLSRLKVLLVLDNVDELEQLEELDLSPKLLRAGSRIIITTRNEHILRVYGADAIHKVQELNNNEASELFLKKAFKSGESSSNCMELTPNVLEYAQGLPLAIRIVGSFLCTRNATQWRDALDRLRNNPNNKIMDILKISFEGLQAEEKEIFLHIACFFKGEREDYVMRILDCCELHPHIGIPVIVEKSLITIRNQEIHMHGMLQELGKTIVQQQFLEEPGHWSRLWLYKDFHRVMETKMGTNNIKAIVLDQKEDVSKFEKLRAGGLSIMTGLRLLILYHNNFSGSLNFLSNSLHYLLWHGYPFTFLPSDFQPDRLVELNLPDSTIKRLWKGVKNFPRLKRVDLSNSKHLMKTPNFKGIPKLERLDLTGCIKLSQVHPSIGLLTDLAFLSLRNCSSLVSLNLGNECNLCSLRILDLSSCTKLQKTPNFIGLSNLEYLDFEGCTSLTTVHRSIGGLAKLKFLSFRHCRNLLILPFTVYTLTSLITLDLYGCLELRELAFDVTYFISNNSCMESLIFLNLGFCHLSRVPDVIGELMHLERLNLEGNNFVSLPETFTKLSNLAYLNLAHCRKFRDFPLYLTQSLFISSSSSGGRYFKTQSGSRNHRSGLYIFNCPKLVNMHQLANTYLVWLLRLVEEPCHFRCGFDITIPGSVIHEWFNNQFRRDSIVRIGRVNVDDNWIGFAFCAAFEVNYRLVKSSSSQLPHPFYLSFESEHVEESFEMPLHLDLNKIHQSKSKHLWLIYISWPHCHFVKTGARITFKARPGLMITGWGFRMVFKQDIETLKWKLRSEIPQGELQITREGNQADPLAFDIVQESNDNYRPQIQLPYNWFIPEDEELENIEAKGKEYNLSNIGLQIGQPL